MSKLEVDKITPQSGTTLTIGEAGDTTVVNGLGTLPATIGSAAQVLSVNAGATGLQYGTAVTDLSNLNATNLTSGTVPDARFPSTLPTANGQNLTAINPTAISSGTLPALNAANLTNLNATTLTSGTLPDARFPATLPAISGANLTNLPASGGMDLLQSVTPSSTPSFILVGDFSSTYRAYKLVLAGIRPVNNNSDMTFQLQTAGGSLATSAYYWSINGQQNGSSVFESGNNETQARYFSNFSNADGGMAVEMLITNPFLAERTVFSGFCGGKRDNSDHGFPQNFSAIHYTATSYTKLKIAGTQNSFTWADTGKILLYGLKES